MCNVVVLVDLGHVDVVAGVNLQRISGFFFKLHRAFASILGILT